MALPYVTPSTLEKEITNLKDVLEKEIEEGGNPLPEVTPEDKDKYLHTNELTGELEWAEVEGGGVTVDSELSETSENPVQNKVIKQALDNKQNSLPTIVNDRYLHTNATTGALEWVTVQGGSSNATWPLGAIVGVEQADGSFAFTQSTASLIIESSRINKQKFTQYLNEIIPDEALIFQYEKPAGSNTIKFSSSSETNKIILGKFFSKEQADFLNLFEINIEFGSEEHSLNNMGQWGTVTFKCFSSNDNLGDIISTSWGLDTMTDWTNLNIPDIEEGSLGTFMLPASFKNAIIENIPDEDLSGTLPIGTYTELYQPVINNRYIQNNYYDENAQDTLVKRLYVYSDVPASHLKLVDITWAETVS